MLEVSKLSVVYGKHHALNDISISVKTGELVVILGANGAGKSSLLRSLVGLCEGEMTGQISLDGKVISDLSPDAIVQLGVALVPEGRAIFGDLSVEENLKLGAYADRARAMQAENQALVFELFPKLRERRKQIARTMSGGEQQMVAVGRALMSAPSILMLDEPSLGLSPLLSKELFQALAQIREKGIGVLVVEQNAKLSLSVADRGYLIEVGNLVGEDSAENLSRDPAVQAAYLGSGGKAAGSAAVVSTGYCYIEPAGAKSQRTKVPFVGTDLGDLLQRAEDVGKSRVGLGIPATANGTSETERKIHPVPPKQRLQSKTFETKEGTLQQKPVVIERSPILQKGEQGGFNTPKRTVNLLQPKTDDRIATLLQEFEDAAAAAWLPQNQSSAPSHAASRSDHEHENEPLPTIPVFRKSDIQVFKRDQHGVLKQTNSKQRKGH